MFLLNKPLVKSVPTRNKGLLLKNGLIYIKVGRWKYYRCIETWFLGTGKNRRKSLMQVG